MNRHRGRQRGRPTGEWVIVHDGTQPDRKPGEAECLRCGDRFIIPTPISLDTLATLGNAYVRQHKKCPERAVPVTGA